MAVRQKTKRKAVSSTEGSLSVSLRSLDTKRQFVVGTPRADARDGIEAPDWRHENIGRLLLFAFAAFEARMIDGYRLAGFDDVRQVHLNALRHVDARSGTRIVDLAARAGVTKGAMGQMLDECVRLELVHIRPDPRDSRAKLVRLSPRGTKFMTATRRSVAAIEREFAALLGEETYEVICEGLRKLRSAIASSNAS